MKRTDFIRASILNICFDSLLEMNYIFFAIDILTLNFDYMDKTITKRENADYKLTKLFHWILFNGVQEGLYEIINLFDYTFILYEKLEFLKKFLEVHKFFKVKIYY
jgi:hypothetical protein